MVCPINLTRVSRQYSQEFGLSDNSADCPSNNVRNVQSICDFFFIYYIFSLAESNVSDTMWRLLLIVQTNNNNNNNNNNNKDRL